MVDTYAKGSVLRKIPYLWRAARTENLTGFLDRMFIASSYLLWSEIGSIESCGSNPVGIFRKLALLTGDDMNV